MPTTENKQTKRPVDAFYMTEKEHDRTVGWGEFPEERDLKHKESSTTLEVK